MPRAENREKFFCSAPAGAKAARFLTSCQRRARMGAPGLFLRDSLFQSARGQRQYRRPRPD